ncbi:MAG: U32 family peptidase [Clostridia bacterium]|nr:U32 family peptidase [Clostridia bacterium]
MKRKNSLPELLAPAGSFDALVAAVEGGADAVYVGGKRFGARAFAKNFDNDELTRAVRYCHIHGVKLYVTVNTLVLDLEMKEVVEYAAFLWKIGVDALIIADLGAIREIRRYVPLLPLHASTQMSVHNSFGADEAAALGCERVVLARECSLADITEITAKSKPEIEIFLHGALCVCHSGQCLFSSMVGGRSGNRGECAQPCRLPFAGGKYPLSLKDLSYAAHIPALIESGVASLKIEGRMKSPTYVYTVTSIFRRLLDEGRGATAEEWEALKRAFSRGGFTDGYLKGKPQSVELGIRSEENKAESRQGEVEVLPSRKKVFSTVKILRNTPAEMTLSDGEGKEVTVIGQIPAEAENSPLTESGVKDRLSKMGNTFLALVPEDIILTLDDGLNLPPSALNALRRAAADEFEDTSRAEISVDYTLPVFSLGARKMTTAQFLGMNPTVSQDARGFDAIFVSLFAEDKTGANGVYLPPVIMESELSQVREALSAIDKEKIKYALVSNIGQIALAKEFSFDIVCDFRLNVTNRFAYKTLSELGALHIILSPEITLPQARDIGGGVIVYGRIPLMITERCFMKDNGGCGRCSNVSLEDRMGERFPMIREFEHRSLILNSKITYMGDRRQLLDKNRIGSYHFIFSTENEEKIKTALLSFKSGKPLSDRDVRRVGRRKNNK